LIFFGHEGTQKKHRVLQRVDDQYFEVLFGLLLNIKLTL